MSAPLDEHYLKWLYKQVAYPEFHNANLTFWKLLNVLYKKEFVWLVPNDENRIADGIALRIEFLDELEEKGVPAPDVDSGWIELGCSVLELMVGLARRLEFDGEGGAHYWFWMHMMRNLELDGYNDRCRLPRRRIDDILDRLIFRNYEPSGLGGLFPLRNPRDDQRERELWCQMGDYLLEQEQAGLRGG